MIIPLLADGKMVLVNQYRYLCDRESLEFPCGSVNENLSYEETAAHELAEEAGYSAREMTFVAEFNPYNGVTDELCRVYIARNLSPVQKARDETEEFEIVHLSPAELERQIRDGKVWDGMTLAAWALIKEKL